ncbi:MAG: lipid A oxidase [Pseudomonadota bacterium]
MIFFRAIFLAFCAACASVGAWAETEISFYFGNQTAPSSVVAVAGDRVIPRLLFSQKWQGASLKGPIYGGARITNWRTRQYGLGLDFAHNKVKPAAGARPPGFSALEFTDGLNTWTANVYYRWPEALGRATPYVGAGAGLSIPGVEVRYAGSDTIGYQVAGPAVTWLGGVSYRLNDQWSLFTEYKGTFSSNRVRLNGGGTLSSDIVTPCGQHRCQFQILSC